MSADDLVNFLREKGVDEENLQKLLADKIDCTTLPLIEDQVLSTYIPCYGDRVSALAFCKTKVGDSDTQNDSGKDVLSRLRRKLSTNGKRQGRKLVGNLNAKKVQKRVEMGWMDFDYRSKSFKQVRSKSGGGTRHLTVDKDILLPDLISTGKDLFFPNGSSGKGNIEDFVCELKDFQGQDVEPVTVVSAYEATRLKILRLYLFTKKKLDMPSEATLEDKPKFETTEDGKKTDDSVVEMGTPTVVVRKQTLQDNMAVASERTSVDCDSSSDSDCELYIPSIQKHQRRSLSLHTPSSSSAVEIPCDTEPSVEVNERDEETDTDLQMAIKASLASSRASKTFEEILRDWKVTTLKNGEPQTILLLRGKVLTCALRQLTKASFKLDHPIKVAYAGEVGEDFGGPTREFLGELMRDLQDYILTGPDGNKQFSHNIQKVSDNKYFTAGQLVAFSLLHGGESLAVLNPLLYKLLTDREFDLNEVSDDCILDEDVNRRIKQIKQAENQTQLKAEIDRDADFFVELGVVSYTLKFEDKEKLLKALIKNELLYKVQSEIVQFKEGMDSIGGLFQKILNAPETMKSLLVNVSDKLTFESFRGLYKINFSIEGSNERPLEKETVYCLESFIMDCAAEETAVTLEQFLGFWTGATKLPPLGFHKQLEVSFITREEECLPIAHTCGMVLELRRGEKNPEAFLEKMVKAIQWTEGFHIA